MKATLEFVLLVCTATLAHATSVVAKVSEEKVVIAADTLGIDSEGTRHEDQCKIVPLGKYVFAAASIASFRTTLPKSSWDSTIEAEAAYRSHETDIEAAASDWLGRAERYFSNLRAVRIRHTWYAETYVKGTREYMHRLILAPGPGERVDHRDGDGLNNYRSNLRLVSSARNQANRRRVGSRSGFKGVTRRGDRWRAYITVAGLFCSLGTYGTAVEAALAYDGAACEHFGEFACTNESLGLLPGVSLKNFIHEDA